VGRTAVQEQVESRACLPAKWGCLGARGSRDCFAEHVAPPNESPITLAMPSAPMPMPPAVGVSPCGSVWAKAIPNVALDFVRHMDSSVHPVCRMRSSFSIDLYAVIASGRRDELRSPIVTNEIQRDVGMALAHTCPQGLTLPRRHGMGALALASVMGIRSGSHMSASSLDSLWRQGNPTLPRRPSA